MSNAIIPIPKIPITIRPGTIDDLAFIDGLQKIHTKQVGFMPTKQFEGKIGAGHVLIAEEVASGQLPVASDSGGSGTVLATNNSQLATSVGYCIGNDQYFKRDDVGIIYQINIAEGKRRSLVGAMLLKAQFDRSAYGCRLYCCWCAQDIEANRFWEAMGFVPLAFRTGSAVKSRVHIFWQKRIRQGDETTPWWFPSQTGGGSIREDRLVLPIPPGKHWSDEMPRILPKEQLPVPSGQFPEKKRVSKRLLATGNSQLATRPALGRLCFAPPKPVIEKPKREKRAKVKNDPKLVAAARELRDRWLERVNSDPLALPSHGKYEVSKELSAPLPKETLQLPQRIAA
jgi:hypothetical protein